MRNVIFFSLLMLTLTLAGGFSIYWYGQAASAKIAVEEAIAKINQTQKYITYDAIETSGFPSNLYVAIVKPHFSGRVDLLLKALNANQPATAAPSQFATMSPWDEDDLLDGRIVFGINAVSDHYSFVIMGNWQQTSKIDGTTVTAVHKQTGSSGCTLQLQHGGGIFGNLWNFGVLSDQGQEFLKNFRSLDCNSAGNTLANPAGKETYANAGPFRFYVANVPQGDMYQVRVFIKAADMEITPQGDAMLTHYFRAFAPTYPYPANFSVYGKQNTEIDFTYYGPADFHKNAQNPTISIDLSKFDITNQVYTHHMTFYLDNSTKISARTAKLNFKAESNFNEQYDTLVQNALHSFIWQTYNNTDPKMKEVQAAMQKYTQDQLYAIIYPALPNFHSLGKLIESVDVTYQGTPDLTAGDITIADFELSGSPYGIKGNGGVNLSRRTPPSGNVTFACSNCLHMVDDMYAYAERLQKVFVYFAPDKAATMTIDPAQTEGIKKFLSILAVPAKDVTDKTTLNFTVVGDATSGVSVNNRKMGDVMAMYNEYVRPGAKQPAAPVAQPTH